MTNSLLPELTAGSAVVQIAGLAKRFGDFVALRPCQLDVPAGEVLGVLGPNGAGKSTLIRLIMGFLQPTEGRAFVAGLDCHRETLQVHERVGYLPSSPKLFRTMSGRQLLRFFCDIRRDGDWELACRLADRLELDLRRWVAFMSTGMRQKLAIAATFANRAPVLILDEPTENLDPNVRALVMELVREAQQAGRTIIFSSHVLSEVEEVADRVVIMRRGELVHQQIMSELQQIHRLIGRWASSPVPLPSELSSWVTVRENSAGKVQLEIRGDLSRVWGWLSQNPVVDVRWETAGLKAIYERFHGGDEEPRS